MSTITGVKSVKEALRKHRQASARGMGKGLRRAGLFLQRESMKLAPIDTGVMRASASTIASGKGLATVVAVGYGTDYAIYVHENLEAQHKPGKTAQFLTGPLITHKDKLGEIVAKAIEDETGI